MICEDLISIVIPVYNVECYIQRCLESIILQSYKNLEIIIVNDGSTDDSLKIANEYKERDNRIIIISQKNAGLSAARNTGIEAANGKYISFVDSDDYIHKQFIETLYINAKKYDADIAVCESIEVNDSTIGDPCKKLNVDYQIEVDDPINAMKLWYNSNFKNPTVAWNKLYKYSLFNECKFSVGKLHEDEFIIHKLYLKSDKIVYLWIEMYFYYQRNNSITGRNNYSIKRLDVLEAYEDRLKVIEECGDTDLIRLNIQQYIDVILGCAVDLDKYYKSDKKEDVINSLKKKIIEIQKKYEFSFKHKVKVLIFTINPSCYCKLYDFLKCHLKLFISYL